MRRGGGHRTHVAFVVWFSHSYIPHLSRYRLSSGRLALRCFLAEDGLGGGGGDIGHGIHACGCASRDEGCSSGMRVTSEELGILGILGIKVVLRSSELGGQRTRREMGGWELYCGVTS